MQDDALGELERLVGRTAVHEEGPALDEQVEDPRVGPLDLVAPRVQPREQRGQASVAPRRRAPVHVEDGNGESGQLRREEREADADDARLKHGGRR